ncbi:Aberrant root formation protein 4 [Melia azedarach]|uniref:Aberrant root formation protein 4 n=1 Tax=Melia azedarach TaxID=155640 RepID=A0ACC1X9W7_MELAZ|nr:Aberrant root formation protein 4 [Melia azedarach]
MITEINQRDPSSNQPPALRLQEILTSISKAIECGNIGESDSLVSELVKFLDSISDAIESDPSNEDIKRIASEILSEIRKFLCSPSLDQAIIDALSFELPKAVTKFAGLSSSCLEIANNIIDRLVATCSPRDMLSILCEALDSLIKTIQECDYFFPLLSGLSKVLLSTQRRHFEQAKVAVPVILKVLKTVSSESDDEDKEHQHLFDQAIGIAKSIRAVSFKLEGRMNEKLCALLGLYVLQIMVLVSVSMGCNSTSCIPLVSQLSSFFSCCHLSYLGLITGSDIDTMTSLVVGEDEDDCMSCQSYVEQGASISVIWGHISDQVAQAAGEDLTAVKGELQSNQAKRWQAIGMLKHIFSSGKLPWEFKKHAIDFLLHITDGNISQKNNDDNSDLSSYMLSVFATLQALITVIMYTPSSAMRKNAFDAFKRVLAEVPCSEKRDLLKAMITNCSSPSMVAILLDLVRQEVLKESNERTSTGKEEIPQGKNKACPNTLFWPAVVLELVDLILKPTKGGPPPLPEHGDAVLSALNLYRFVLLMESKEDTNSTVLSNSNLQKAYNEWLLPLRTLVTGIVTENNNDYDQFAVDTVCTLNPIELVLYRCIELVEEKLKRAT